MTTAVFVHGNPETAAVWEPLLAVLEEVESATLSPPGFGAPVPEGFGATSDDYLRWLVEELEGREPVDLVGHDWGGGHVVRVAMERPDLIRSWTTDVAGCFAPDYTWHDTAVLWQTPGTGEEVVDAMVGMAVEDRAALFAGLGMTADVAREVAGALDAAMGRCILALYRSAAQPVMAQLGAGLAGAGRRPGLVLVPTEDTFTGGEARARWAAGQAGAEVALLSGLGHWWMLQDPAAGAAALRRFWAGLSS